MNKLLEQHEGGFLLEPHTDMHSETVGWLSELEFYVTEISFLSALLDKTIIRTEAKKRTKDIASFEEQLRKFTVRIHALQNSLIVHERNLSILDKDVLALTLRKIKEEHAVNNDAMKTIREDARSIKMDIFKFIIAQLRP